MHLFESSKEGVALATLASSAAAAAALGGRAVSKRNLRWYQRKLSKPGFTPPAWVFGPVWSALYTAMVLSAFRVFRAEPSHFRKVALGLWTVQLGLNAAWTPLFFGKRAPRLALVDVLALAGALTGYVASAAKVDRPAAYAMAPYLAWTGFAAVLNGEIVRRNPTRV